METRIIQSPRCRDSLAIYNKVCKDILRYGCEACNKDIIKLVNHSRMFLDMVERHVQRGNSSFS